MRALIVDDEPIARQVLREELELLSVEITGEAENGEAALLQIAKTKPDVILLDVQMPVMNGFEFLSHLDEESAPAIIMVTAYDQHALEAFKAGAVDYLLKPVSGERLSMSLARIRRLIRNPGGAADQVKHLQKLAPPAAGRSPIERKIVGKSGAEFFLLNIGDVLAFQAEGDLTWIITAKQKYFAAQNLRALDDRLKGSSFRRIHRNALVNVHHILKMSMITSQRWLLTLSNGQEFVVSKRQAKNVRDVLSW